MSFVESLSPFWGKKWLRSSHMEKRHIQEPPFLIVPFTKEIRCELFAFNHGNCANTW